MSRFVAFLSFLLVAATFINCDGHDSDLSSVLCVDSDLEFQLDVHSAKMTTCDIILTNDIGLVDELKVDKYCSNSNVRELCSYTCGLCKADEKKTTTTTRTMKRKTKKTKNKKTKSKKSKSPSSMPTLAPSAIPSANPSSRPTRCPTITKSPRPSQAPTKTTSPTVKKSKKKSKKSKKDTPEPSSNPSREPSVVT